MKKRATILVLTLFFAIFINHIAIAKDARQALTADYVPPKYTANFDYTPDSQAAPGSAGVTFAIGPISYNYQASSKIPWYSSSQFANLPDEIRRDLSKIFTAKGFSVRGPFDTYDLIPYQDKKAIDLYLLPALELLVTIKDSKMPSESGALRVAGIHVTGIIEVSGKVVLELREIMTRELMWTKNIPIKQFEFPYDQYVESYRTEDGPYNSGIIINEMAKGIETRYPDIMATIFKLIDAEEMGILKKQCQELKSKKGY